MERSKHHPAHCFVSGPSFCKFKLLLTYESCKRNSIKKNKKQFWFFQGVSWQCMRSGGGGGAWIQQKQSVEIHELDLRGGNFVWKLKNYSSRCREESWICTISQNVVWVGIWNIIRKSGIRRFIELQWYKQACPRLAAAISIDLWSFLKCFTLQHRSSSREKIILGEKKVNGRFSLIGNTSSVWCKRFWQKQ